jgi:ElaB/YqjD/DUF883 family membrane-anchored ribosome-binding protein
MTSEKEKSDQRADEATSPTMDALKRTDNAIRDTARTYLGKFGVNLDIVRVETSIRERPLRFTAIAATAGFIVGGGMTTRPGVAILALFGRKVVTETAANLITGMARTGER